MTQKPYETMSDDEILEMLDHYGQWTNLLCEAAKRIRKLQQDNRKIDKAYRETLNHWHSDIMRLEYGIADD